MNCLVLAAVLALAPGQGRRADDAGVEPGHMLYEREAGSRPAPRVARYVPVFAQEVPAPARDAYRRALGRYRKGNAAGAAALLRGAVARFPDYYDANLALGVVEGAAGRFVESEAALGEAIRVFARDPRAHFFRAAALVSLSDAEADPGRRAARLDEAAHELDRAWELSAGLLAVVHLQRARILERRGDRLAAAEAIERYLAAAPKAPTAAALREAAAKLRAR